MTRANTEQLKNTPWFAKAGAACSILAISRFVSANIFALKGGGYGFRQQVEQNKKRHNSSAANEGKVWKTYIP